MRRRVVTIALGLAVIGLTLLSTSVSTQPVGRCLHDSRESAQQQRRRMDAIALARAINRAEYSVQLPRRQNPPMFKPLDQLLNLPPTPNGFAAQLHTDGSSYAFSLKDTFDRCQFAIFSDQDQVIYEGLPMSSSPQVVPLDIQ